MKILLYGFEDEDESIFKKGLKELSDSLVEIIFLKKNVMDSIRLSDEMSKNVGLIFIDDKIFSENSHQTRDQIEKIKARWNVPIIISVSDRAKPGTSEIIIEGLAEFISKPLTEFEIAARSKTCLKLNEEQKKNKASEKWFYQVVESMPVIFADYVDGINAVYANRLGSRIWGMSHDAVMNPPSKWTQFIHPDDKEWVLKAIRLLGKDTLNIQYRIIRPDGQLRWIDDSFIPVFDSNGKRTRVFGFGRDITRRKIAEHSLKKSDEHLRSLMETATNFAIYRLSHDIDDPLQADIIFASPSIMDIMGITEMEVNTWFKRIIEKDKKIITAAIKKKPVVPKLDETVRIFHPSHQEQRWIQIIENRLTDEKGNLKYSNGIMIDVTDRIKATAALREKDQLVSRQAEKLQKVNDALSVLLEHQEKKQVDMQKSISETIDKLVIPYLLQLSTTELDQNQQTIVDIISSNLFNVTSSFVKSLSSWKKKMSPTEIRIAALVKNGKSSKEMAELFNVSPATISFHRANIRTKLGINNEKINLTSYLQSLENE